MRQTVDTMVKLGNKYDSPAYWTQLIQLMLYENINDYLVANGMTKKEFAEKLGVSKGYVSQILNGDFDHKLSKLTELALACDLVPRFDLVPSEYAEAVVRDTYMQPKDWRRYDAFSRMVPFRNTDTVARNDKEIQMRINFRSSDIVCQSVDCWQSETSLNRIA